MQESLSGWAKQQEAALAEDQDSTGLWNLAESCGAFGSEPFVLGIGLHSSP